MYKRKSRMTVRQQNRLLEHFVAGTTARAAAQLVDVQRTTAITFYQRLRKLIAGKLPSYELSGEVEADESYFGGRRKGKRGRGSAGNALSLNDRDTTDPHARDNRPISPVSRTVSECP